MLELKFDSDGSEITAACKTQNWADNEIDHEHHFDVGVWVYISLVLTSSNDILIYVNSQNLEPTTWSTLPTNLLVIFSF